MDTTDFKLSQSTVVANTTTADVQPPKVRPRPIVRLPPPQSRASTYINHAPKSPPARGDVLSLYASGWEELFNNAKMNRRPVVNQRLEVPATDATIGVPSDDLINGEAASTQTDDDQGQTTPVKGAGRKKRRRRTRAQLEAKAFRETMGEASHNQVQTTTFNDNAADPTAAGSSDDTGYDDSDDVTDGEGRTTRRAESDGNPIGRQFLRGGGEYESTVHPDMGSESSQPQSLVAPGFPSNRSTSAALLHAAQSNWENVCHLVMGEVSQHDREILNQIAGLVRRLGANHVYTPAITQSLPADQEGVMTCEVPSQSAGEVEWQVEDPLILDSPEGSQESFHTALEDCVEDGADDHYLLEPQEDEAERQARLERIGSRLLMIRAEHPIEEKPEMCHDPLRT
ncbi:MAG: hypothetical protein L6R39_006039 [Caloplaca ligustica]|nr:MAG: hypothetical protein L6R39_006039 [Caloplaca ligustica]